MLWAISTVLCLLTGDTLSIKIDNGIRHERDLERASYGQTVGPCSYSDTKVYMQYSLEGDCWDFAANNTDHCLVWSNKTTTAFCPSRGVQANDWIHVAGTRFSEFLKLDEGQVHNFKYDCKDNNHWRLNAMILTVYDASGRYNRMASFTGVGGIQSRLYSSLVACVQPDKGGTKVTCFNTLAYDRVNQLYYITDANGAVKCFPSLKASDPLAPGTQSGISTPFYHVEEN